jgi:hypothetical protein
MGRDLRGSHYPILVAHLATVEPKHLIRGRDRLYSIDVIYLRWAKYNLYQLLHERIFTRHQTLVMRIHRRSNRSISTCSLPFSIG